MQITYFFVIFVIQIILVRLDYTEFLRKSQYDNKLCVDDSNGFVQGNTTLGRCIAECEIKSQCLGIVFIIGDNTCMGCLTVPNMSPISTVSFYFSKQPFKAFYIGCYVDYYPNRALSGYNWNNNGMTNDLCQQSCFERGYKYAGTQYFYYCFCGHSYNDYDTPNEADCTYMCWGNNEQICGANMRNSIYEILV